MLLGHACGLQRDDLLLLVLGRAAHDHAGVRHEHLCGLHHLRGLHHAITTGADLTHDVHPSLAHHGRHLRTIVDEVLLLLLLLGHLAIRSDGLRLHGRLVQHPYVQGLPRHGRWPPEHLTHLLGRRIVDAVPQDGRGCIVVQQRQEAHGRGEAARVRKDLGVLRELRVEEWVGLVELRRLLEHRHLLDQVLEGEFVGPGGGDVRVGPDADGLREVLGADVADDGRADVGGLRLQPVRELLAQHGVLLLRVGGDDGQGLHPILEVRGGHQLLKVVGHDVPHRGQERVALQPQVLVARPGPQRGAAAGGQQQRLGHAAALEAALHGSREVADEQGLLDEGLGARGPVRHAVLGGRAERQLRSHGCRRRGGLDGHALLLRALGQVLEKIVRTLLAEVRAEIPRCGSRRGRCLLLLRRRAHQGGAGFLAQVPLGLLLDALLVKAEERGQARAARIVELKTEEVPHQALINVARRSLRLLLAELLQPTLASPRFEPVCRRDDLRLVRHHKGVAER
mmetsp:Transcript_20665/g.53817  ORF Transcript_20665/g.53817 Transcript_20665/m.53817 type:complete len:510 (+) Transcript_20665:303-1832(+)